MGRPVPPAVIRAFGQLKRACAETNNELGKLDARRTRLDQVSFGSLELDDVRATITPGLGSQALLGMSFLKHFNMRQEGDRLLIEGREAR